jgi:hypothetical protein
MTDKPETQNENEGLSHDDTNVLNSAEWVMRGEDGISDYLNLIATLRVQYQEDALAIEQIDIFDPNSPFQAKNDEWLVALRNGDEQKIEELKLWFEENHPLTFGMRQKALEAYL